VVYVTFFTEAQRRVATNPLGIDDEYQHLAVEAIANFFIALLLLKN
jgi:hypothetical protein